MDDVNNITACKTNEKTMIELITIKSKNNDNFVIDTFIKGNDNIGEIVTISREALETKVKEETDIIDNEVVKEMKYVDTNIKNDYHDDSMEDIIITKVIIQKIQHVMKITILFLIFKQNFLIKVLDGNKIKKYDVGKIISEKISDKILKLQTQMNILLQHLRPEET